MKLDNGTLMLACFIRLFKVFLQFPGGDASEYRKCMLVNLLLWSHYSIKNLPIYEMMQHNASMCNEEAGELAFSVLARTISSNSSRMDIDSVNRHFILSRLKLDVANDLNLDIADRKTVLINNHHIIKTDSPEVIAVGVHFLGVVNNLKTNFFHHYPTKPAEAIYNFKNSVAAQLKLVSSRDEEVKEWYLPDSKPVLQSIIDKTKKALSGEWLSQHSELWPEAKSVVVEEKDAESSGWEEASPLHPSMMIHHGLDSDASDARPLINERDVKERKKKRLRGRMKSYKQIYVRPNGDDSWEDETSCDGERQVVSPPPALPNTGVRSRYSRAAKPRQSMHLPGSDHEDRFFAEAKWDGDSASDD